MDNKFGIENGGEILKKYFSNVTVEEFNGKIVVDKAEPVVSYVTSIISARKSIFDEHKLDSFYKYVETEIDKEGSFSITTKGGMFTVSKS